MDISTIYAYSSSFNPYYNLSIEEFLLDNVKANEIILYLWQNKDTIVIGKNQNPYKECDNEKLKRSDIILARRLSGGGTVYHDTGNLNFTFIMKKELFDLEKFFDIILKAVNSFGINAKFSGRNDLLIHDKKFSGNAYYFDENSCYHHGTILIDSDMNKLSEYLTPSKVKIISKGIDSVRSRVINLKEIDKSITIDLMKKRLLDSFEKAFEKAEFHYEFTPDGLILHNRNNTVQTDTNIKNLFNYKIDSLYKKYSSWQWIYGESPQANIIYEERFSWGNVQINMDVKDGFIQNAKFYSDALDTEIAGLAEKALIGERYDKRDIKKMLFELSKKQIRI